MRPKLVDNIVQRHPFRRLPSVPPSDVLVVRHLRVPGRVAVVPEEHLAAAVALIGVLEAVWSDTLLVADVLERVEDELRLVAERELGVDRRLVVAEFLTVTNMTSPPSDWSCATRSARYSPSERRGPGMT